jgi:hypothetical protein
MGMSPELIRKEDLHQKYRSIYKARKKMMLKEIVVCILFNDQLIEFFSVKMKNISLHCQIFTSEYLLC